MTTKSKTRPTLWLRGVLPIRLPSTANLREHWATRAKRTKIHRMLGKNAARTLLRGLQDECVEDQIRVRLIRVAPKPLDDDNLASAFKGIRDGVADALCFDDGDPRLTWIYAQEKRSEYGIRIEIQSFRD